MLQPIRDPPRIGPEWLWRTNVDDSVWPAIQIGFERSDTHRAHRSSSQHFHSRLRCGCSASPGIVPAKCVCSFGSVARRPDGIPGLLNRPHHRMPSSAPKPSPAGYGRLSLRKKTAARGDFIDKDDERTEDPCINRVSVRKCCRYSITTWLSTSISVTD